ncbi:ArsR family transcriptional regulator [Rhodobacterales bacterium 52_120_T64]|nr:ArsR family transcriptional regulator [Rhodobacterales bacterium 52_120_T64]
MNLEQMEEKASEVSGLLRVMSNQWRLLILCNLAQGEHSVQELQKLVGLGQSALSQHLAILRYEGLVSTRRVAQSIYYSIASPEAEKLLGTLYEIYCLEILGDGTAQA